MSKVFLVIALVMVANGVLDAKSADKNAKKAFSAKPTKGPKSVVEQFSGLPEDDVKFIKELDKQFKLHGDKIKIRIERDNSTAAAASGKNSKRGLDGDLGYGFHRNRRPGPNFFFSKPKLEFYPYSQEDIPPLPHVAQQQLQQQQFHQQLHHRNRQRLNYHARPQPFTHVEIQPSPGYEIKENTFDHPPPPQPPQPYHQDFQPQQVYAEPVIVLKIPGPQKYAAHLKVLLQQYLELRAAQYIQELQQQEQAHLHGNAVQETYVEEHIPETNAHTLGTQPIVPHEVYGPPGHQETSYVHQEHQEVPVEQAYEAPQQVQAVYEEHQQGQAVYEDHQQGQGAYENHQQGQVVYEEHQQGQAVYEAPQQGQAVYETHEVHYAPQQAVFINQNLYQQDPRHAYQGPAYLPAPDQPAEQQYYYQQQEQHHHGEDNLPTSENYPSEHHTRVVFTKELQKAVTPSTTHVEYQQEYQGPVEAHSTVAPVAFRAQEYYQPHEMEVDVHGEEGVVAITQKPFNYHSHVSSSTTLSPSKSAKRDAPPFTQEQFKKLSKLVHKLKRKQEGTEDST